MLVRIELLGQFLHVYTYACAESLEFNHRSGLNHTHVCLSVLLSACLSVSLSVCLHPPFSLFFSLFLAL